MPKQSFWRAHLSVIIAALFLAVGVISHATVGEDHFLTIAAYIGTIVIGGQSLFRSGIKNLSRLIFDMKTLMTIAIIGAVFIGEWGEGAVVVILFAISEMLERYSLDKSRQSIQSLMDIAPNEALIRRDGETVTVPVQDIEPGDILLVKPGDKIAMDGTVMKGTSAINQAAITGESVPIAKAEGDDVFAGTLNGEGFLEVTVTKRSEDTTLAKIIHLVEEAQAEKAPSQAFVDRFAKYYTPAIIIVAAMIAVFPPLFAGASWETWIYQGLAVLVVGCPCALVISTPVSIITAIGNAAKNGILIKGGIYLEEMGTIEAIAFDKTGTLTNGTPVFSGMRVFQGEEDDVLGYLAALEYHSQHPLANAILDEADKKNLAYTSIPVTDFQSITGNGIQGTINGTTYYVGKPALFRETLGITVPETIMEEATFYQEAGKTVMLFGTSQHVLAVAAVADELRATSTSVIKQLHALGIKETIMLTGDNTKTAEAIALEAGVSNIESELLPQDKLTAIDRLMKKYKHVAMVGDGVNDAPALAKATVGVAMGGAGTDTALETADVALMADDLNKLPYTVRLSRKALTVIKQNVTFSIGIKVLALLLVIPGWLTLWIAIFADMGATLLVTLNGLRLLRLKKE